LDLLISLGSNPFFEAEKVDELNSTPALARRQKRVLITRLIGPAESTER
jgi:hypothetical protein